MEKDVAVIIGNTDNKLSQQDWRDYVEEVRNIVESAASQIHFFGGPPNYAEWQNACIVFQTSDDYLPILEEKLAIVRDEYIQESVAVIVGVTKLI